MLVKLWRFTPEREAGMENNRVPLPVAAKELGMSQQAVREHMKRKVIDIGYVLPGAVSYTHLRAHETSV